MISYKLVSVNIFKTRYTEDHYWDPNRVENRPAKFGRRRRARTSWVSCISAPWVHHRLWPWPSPQSTTEPSVLKDHSKEIPTLHYWLDLSSARKKTSIVLIPMTVSVENRVPQKSNQEKIIRWLLEKVKGWTHRYDGRWCRCRRFWFHFRFLHHRSGRLDQIGLVGHFSLFLGHVEDWFVANYGRRSSDGATGMNRSLHRECAFDRVKILISIASAFSLRIYITTQFLEQKIINWNLFALNLFTFYT